MLRPYLNDTMLLTSVPTIGVLSCLRSGQNPAHRYSILVVLFFPFLSMDTNTDTCDCALCKNNHEFKISNELMGELLSGKVTVFAGAGISTENRNVLKHTFYDSVAAEIGSEAPYPEFPDLMESYCRQPNGRLKLLNRIRDRFDHIDSFPELTRSATRFHRELGTFFPIQNIVTTNWDNYFEEYCRATPFVTDSDLAFWEAANRRVLKIHGSVTNYGSIVATREDYQRCQENLNVGLIGSTLKTILATQTVIFIGYSLSDPDFSAIYDFVKTQMNSLHKQAYIVTPFSKECETFRDAGLIPIQTDGAYFISQVKAHAVAQGHLLDDDIFDSAKYLLYKVYYEHDLLHSHVKTSDFPEVIFAASYQDGLIHALERAIQMKGSGRYSHRCEVAGIAKLYLEWQEEKRKHSVFEDVAYIEGYVNGLTYLLMGRSERESADVPMYFIFGVEEEISDINDFVELHKSNPIAHKAAHKRAQDYVNRLDDPSSVEFHHPPWL